ncbi:SGNH/GDSL hydrolase family protein [Streptomyces sp. NPDC051940]|uniref:SGNH/GDSL hydrolase family protein n=1 Tax=Streptomyces sp. NPDC051940 TaxID=3155675 RepID=UPI003438E349
MNGRGASPRSPDGGTLAPVFAALGDSLTEGIGDPVPGGAWRGWAQLLAEALPGVVFAKLARSGALSADVAHRQLPEALRLRPCVASVVVGGNDTLRASFDIHCVVSALDLTLGALHAQGATVLTACLPDPGRVLGLPWPLARPLARRMDAVNTAVHELSARYRTRHVHLAGHPQLTDRRHWSVDRLHPSERGHRLIARDFHTGLAGTGLPLGPPPAPEPASPPPTRADSARWMAVQGTRWIADRCTDLLPGLLGLAVSEGRHRLLRTGATLDERARDATRIALVYGTAAAADRAPAPVTATMAG